MKPLDHTAPDIKQQVEARLLLEAKNYEDRQIRELADRVLKDTIKENNQFNPVLYVEHTLNSFPPDSFITPMNDQGGDTVYMYKPELGIYEDTGIPFIEQTILEIMGSETKTSYYRNSVKHLQVKTYTKPEDFEENPYVVVMQNGCYNVLTHELEPFNPQYRARSRIPVTYDPEAKCPAFLRFLSEVIPDEVDIIQEWIGYHFLKEYRYQRCVVLHGDGDNGKTTLINVIEHLLGADNIESKSLFELTADKFAKADLHGKLANLSRDIGAYEMKHTGTLKTLTGNDMISAQRKNRDPFQFRNHAKLTFACNQIPTTPDESLAFFKRIIVVPFNRTFSIEEQDDTLTEKLTTPTELSGIFNWAIEGLKRVIERGCLLETRDTVEKKAFYLAMSNPVTGFFNTCIEEDPEAWELKQAIFTAFAKYCREKGFVAYSDTTFVKQFKKLAFYREFMPKVDGRQQRAWKGIRLLRYTQDTQVTQGSQTSLKRGVKNGE